MTWDHLYVVFFWTVLEVQALELDLFVLSIVLPEHLPEQDLFGHLALRLPVRSSILIQKI
jgi:hypothetical protein